MPLLEITNLSVSFGGLKAVNNFSMTIEQGEIVGLIGPNGAGKTTVFNLITGYFRPTSGEVRFAGHSLLNLRPHQVARLGITRTFQNIRLFKANSVMDNVRVAFHTRTRYTMLDAFVRSPRFKAEERRVTERTLELLRTLGLARRAYDRADSLPYGDQRRLEIARALAGEPRLLLLDEPAAGMNPAEVKQMVELIKAIKEMFGLTILVIEHQMGLVMNLCQRVVVMDFGEIIAEGSPQEVRQNPAVLQAYLGKGAVA